MTSQTLGVRIMRFSRALQLDGSRAASALGNKRRVLADLGEEVWPLVIMTGWEKFCCLSELELTE